MAKIETSKKTTPKKNRWLRILAKIVLGLLILFVAIILFIRSPWGQDIIVSKVVDYVSGRTQTKVTVDKLFITFSGNIFLEGLYLEDTKGDTLVYSRKLEASVAFLPLVTGEEINIKSLDWSGLTANIYRDNASKAFNFNFLIDAFAPQEDSSEAKTENADSMDITLGVFNFDTFRIAYKDDVLGLESFLKLGILHLEVAAFDLESMKYQIREGTIQNTDISYTQTKNITATTDTAKAVLPNLSVDNLGLQDISISYKSIPDATTAQANIGDFKLQLPKADLNAQAVQLTSLSLEDSDISYTVRTVPRAVSQEDIRTENQTNFEWPGWTIDAQKILFRNNRIAYSTGVTPPTAGVFDADHIILNRFSAAISKTRLKDEQLNLQLDALSFTERSGFQINEMGLDLSLNDHQLSVSKIKVRTAASYLTSAITLNYASINQLLNRPEASQLALNVPSLGLQVKELYFFQPVLSNNRYIKTLAQKPLSGTLEAQGSADSLRIPLATIAWGDDTRAGVKGSLKNLLDIENIALNVPEFKFKTRNTDIAQFVHQDSLGIKVPDSLTIQASAEGLLNNFVLALNLYTPDGSLAADGAYVYKKKHNFRADLAIRELQLGKILRNAEWGTVSLTAKTAGNGTTLNTLNATLETDFEQLQFKTYDFAALDMRGELQNGEGSVLANFKDDNLEAAMDMKMVLDSLAPEFLVRLDLKGADLEALGITKENIKTQFKLRTNFKGNSEAFDVTSSLTDILTVYDNEPYPVADLNINAQVKEAGTQMSISSSFLQADLRSNVAIGSLSDALQRQFKNYFSETDSAETLEKKAYMQLEVSLKQDPVLNDVFFQGLEQLDAVSININFDEAQHSLTADMKAPYIKYQESELDSLQATIVGDKESLDFQIGWAGVRSGPLDIQATSLQCILKDKVMALDFKAFDEKERLAHIAAELRSENNAYILSVRPEDLILNRKFWSIPENNAILFTDSSIEFQDFTLGYKQQQLSLSSPSNSEGKQLRIDFDNFKLSTFTSLLNPDETIAKGSLNGGITFEHIFSKMGFLADLSIGNLEALQVPLGNFEMNATSQGINNYNFDLALKGAMVDLNLDGGFTAAKEGALLDLQLKLTTLDLGIIDALDQDIVSEGNGTISGNATITGNTNAIEYEGRFTFKEAGLLVNALNTRFNLAEEQLNITDQGIFFNDFVIADANTNNFRLNGRVLTESLTNPSFDLSVKANDFQVINSTKADNDLFYGKVKMNANLTVKGDLNVPKVNGTLKINEASNFTFVVPESQLDIMEREGVVLFVNRENPDDILTRVDDESSSSAILKGYDIDGMLSVDKDSKFKIVIDERSGDNFEVSGKGDFNFRMDPSGRIALSGRYEVANGHYEASLYGLVKRRFNIAPSSTITWAGDPFDAELDVRAIYEVETSAAPLMATQTSGESAAIANKFRQKVPFLVYLNVDGELLEPEISFALDIPEEEQGALGGEVYSSVQQLNTQEEELNKQVFSLLVLNRFFPGSTSDGSAGGPASIARDNVNKVLSGQLNNFSDKLTGNTGVQLDFGLDSFTDYQGASPEQRTQLDVSASKKLFNDRLIVQVGSEVDIEGSSQTSESTPVIGNVSLEYLLTENGRFRLKGFRRNEFESVIDGQLIVTGIALIFNKEFNSFEDLFIKAIKAPKKDTETKKSKNKEQKD